MNMPSIQIEFVRLKGPSMDLKKASRSWNMSFHEKLKVYGFSISPDEYCMYVKSSGSVVVYLVLYVDDILDGF